jgi:hypothetical protein
MQFGCAIFLATVIGIAAAILACLSILFWHARSPRDLLPNEKLLETIKQSETKRHSIIARRRGSSWKPVGKQRSA